MSWPEAADRPLVDLLRVLPDVPQRAFPDAASLPALLTRGELHGVAGLVYDAAVASGLDLEPALRERLERVRLARELDHAAHLAILARVDSVLAAAGLRAVLLKGALFAERFYPRPSARATSDIDLLVEESELDAASAAICRAGYQPADDSTAAAWARREHHHLHFEHPHALPLELHFHAFRGLGAVLLSGPLLARSRPIAGATFESLRVLAPSDELVFLAVHAAAHRFVRLGWLYDLRLLVARMSGEELAMAGATARATGYARPVALALSLLIDVLGVDAARLGAFDRLGRVREPVLRGVVGEGDSAVLRSATRLVYTMALCHSSAAALRYASTSSRAHARRVLATLRSAR